MDPGAAARAALHASLNFEAGILKRKHQRKGTEYCVKEGAARPSITRGATASGVRLLGSPVAAKPRPVTAPVWIPDGSGFVMKEDTVMGSVEFGMNAYDPEEARNAEYTHLMAEVTKKREEASELRHHVMMLLARREDLDHESEKMRYEDDVEKERADGKLAVEVANGRLAELEDELLESEAYKLTLDHMYRRNREQRVETLALQKAFEDSLAAHSKEYSLKQGLLEDVRVSKEEEVEALRALEKSATKELSELQKKMEARKGELRLQQEKARMRIAKAAHDRLILQQAELSGADEAPLASRVKEALIQAAEVRNIKSKAQQAADAQEALYHQLRFAAGVASHEPLSIALGPSTILSDSDTEDREDLTFPEPDAMTIITRFGELENELKLVETQIGEFGTRLRALKQRHGVLLVAKQPKARDAKDEFDSDLTRIDSLTRRQDTAKRAVEAARAEAREADAVKIQLQQSIAILAKRLDTIPFPPKDMLGPGSSVGELDDTALVEQYIRRDAKTQGVGWNSTMHSQIFKAVEKLHALHRVLHHPKAVRALHDARVWLEGDLFPDRKAQTPSRLPKSPSMFPISNEDKKSGGNSPCSHLEGSNSLGLIDREDFTPAIEELVAASEWSVRVPSLPPAHRKSHISVAIEEDTTTRTTKLLSEAAVSFEKHLRAHVGKALRDDAEFGEVTGKASGRMVSAGEKDASERTLAQLETARTRRASVAGQATNALKPKSRDLQRMLAAAMQMSGTDVDEFLMTGARAEVEEVVTRVQLKRSTSTQMRQIMKQQRRAAESKERETRADKPPEVARRTTASAMATPGGTL